MPLGMSDDELDEFDPYQRARLLAALKGESRQPVDGAPSPLLAAIGGASRVPAAYDTASDAPDDPAQPTQRQPLRPQAGYSPEVREFMLKRLRQSQQPVNPDDVLASEGATAYSAAQPGIAGIRNAMRESVGMSASARPTNVAADIGSDKAKLAEWARRRRGEGDDVAQKLLAADETSRRTAAYEDAQRSAAAMRAEHDAMLRERDAATREKQVRDGEFKAKDLELKERGLDDKRAARAAGAAAKAMKAAEKAAGMDIPFDGGVLKATTTAMRDSDISHARERAALANAALSGMDDVERAMVDYIKAPASQKAAAKAAIEAQLGTVASTANAANGGGAMASDEFKRVSASMGADVMSAPGLVALFNSLYESDPEKAGHLMLSRVRAARSAMRNSAVKQAASYNYEFKPGAKAAQGAQADGSKRIREKATGKEKTLPADVAARFLGQAGYEEVK